ncbi:formate dehydrogenase subunit delta [Pseudovibrio sp. Tun.PSC04-5.I4]|uniref:formate dehydrogenase subunit delta n=1 Tax=Pseudovibrio sp. Tun.PSC04-5.I4 TaxID=1798213 RepID=UPI00088F920E|nr:formate dehydrogenase subunit delta [Pseudovibrio sp. Tun.PSC04-5.I4]SDR40279.1 formate dehydrogenase delta subunit [Pseudovibrio sp. Tun.PSC04-5.I4]
MSPDKLIYMANQIASFFKYKPHEEAVAGIADHINSFWEPRMRSQLFAILKTGSTDLSPLVVDAGSAIRKPKA